MRSAEHSNPIAEELESQSGKSVHPVEDPAGRDPITPQQRRLTVVNRFRVAG